MKRPTADGAPGLAEQLAHLDGLDGENLKQCWRSLYGTEPPPRVGRSLLRQAIAYRLQENALGGLRPSTRRLLQQVATDADAGRAANTASERKLKPGAVLLREWHGNTHQVTVLADGVRFRGQRYRSLILLPSRLKPPIRRVQTRARREMGMTDEERLEEVQRWTAKRRVALVLGLLRGETTVAEAARKHGITVAEIEQWRDRFLLGAENALRARPKDEEALREGEIKRLQRKVGELTMDLDIVKEANKLRPSMPGTSQEQ
jgi:transposase-like protein